MLKTVYLDDCGETWPKNTNFYETRKKRHIQSVEDVNVLYSQKLNMVPYHVNTLNSKYITILQELVMHLLQKHINTKVYIPNTILSHSLSRQKSYCTQDFCEKFKEASRRHRGLTSQQLPRSESAYLFKKRNGTAAGSSKLYLNIIIVLQNVLVFLVILVKLSYQ